MKKGDIVEFMYEGQHVKGKVLRNNGEAVCLELMKDYQSPRSGNVWVYGDHKVFMLCHVQAINIAK